MGTLQNTYVTKPSGGVVNLRVYSKEPIENAYYHIKELPTKGFNDQLVLFVDHYKLADWHKLTETAFHLPIRWVV